MNAPTINFTAEQIAYFEASLNLHKSQTTIVAPTNVVVAPVKSAPTNVVAPVKSVVAPVNVDAPYGYKADGTPRKRPVPTWLPNMSKTDVAPIAPVKSKSRKSKSAPTNVAPVIAAPTNVPSADWRDELARNGSTQHIRILAAELALFGAKSRKLTPVLTAKCATKGAASDHYQSLAKRVAAKKLDIRNGSANWKLAAAIIGKVNA